MVSLWWYLCSGISVVVYLWWYLYGYCCSAGLIRMSRRQVLRGVHNDGRLMDEHRQCLASRKLAGWHAGESKFPLRADHRQEFSGSPGSREHVGRVEAVIMWPPDALADAMLLQRQKAR